MELTPGSPPGSAPGSAPSAAPAPAPRRGLTSWRPGTLRRLLAAAVLVDATYWALWFGHRGWVAADTGTLYTGFENAFPAADAWLGVACLLGWEALRRPRPTALLWLLAGGGAGLYLLAMDVLYDVEHGIYRRGAGGVIEAGVNVATLLLSVIVLRWGWARRADLLGTAAPPGPPRAAQTPDR